MNPLEMTF